MIKTLWDFMLLVLPLFGFSNSKFDMYFEEEMWKIQLIKPDTDAHRSGIILTWHDKPVMQRCVVGLQRSFSTVGIKNRLQSTHYGLQRLHSISEKKYSFEQRIFLCARINSPFLSYTDDAIFLVSFLKLSRQAK